MPGGPVCIAFVGELGCMPGGVLSRIGRRGEPLGDLGCRLPCPRSSAPRGGVIQGSGSGRLCHVRRRGRPRVHSPGFNGVPVWREGAGGVCGCGLGPAVPGWYVFGELVHCLNDVSAFFVPESVGFLFHKVNFDIGGGGR